MLPYSSFAEFYDALMTAADYKARAVYICKLLSRHGADFGLTLDLACGTGSLTLELAKSGVDIYGADVSHEMLSKAQQKAADEGLSILFLRQKMQELDLFGTVDTVICTLDGINHLPGIEEVIKAFKRVSLFLNDGGHFIFDVNTVYKHREVLKNNAFVFENSDVFCVWQNSLLSDGRTVSINLDFFTKRIDGVYDRTGESFKETAFTHEEIEKALALAGLSTVAVYADMTFMPLKENDEKAVYLTRKMHNNG